MKEDLYWTLINYLLMFNTLPVAGFASLCFVWSGIARTPTKQTIFAAFGGLLVGFVILRLVAAMLPVNLTLLIVIGVLHGLMGIVQTVGFLMVTFIVKRRMHELQDDQDAREVACSTPQAERLDNFEMQLFDFGRKAGWIK